jgi:triosephosphate isomerase
MKKLIVGNWKMNGEPACLNKPMKFDEIYPSHARNHLDIVLCPPSLLIPGMMDLCKDTNIQLGSQNCHYLDKGAFTGEISAGMLKNFDVKFVILGHSERRAMGETNEEVSLKAIKVLEEDLTPIVCVGENLEIRKSGQAHKFVAEQIKRSIATLNEGFIIAYEPIWAIGTGVTASIDDIRNMHIEIRNIIGPDIKILYGGSVNIKNAAEILRVENVNGVLVGGASLDMADFACIARAAG